MNVNHNSGIRDIFFFYSQQLNYLILTVHAVMMSSVQTSFVKHSAKTVNGAVKVFYSKNRSMELNRSLLGLLVHRIILDLIILELEHLGMFHQCGPEIWYGSVLAEANSLVQVKCLVVHRGCPRQYHIVLLTYTCII